MTILEYRANTFGKAVRHYKDIKNAILADAGMTPPNIIRQCREIYNDYYASYGMGFISEVQ